MTDDKFDPFYIGKCLFCGKEANEHFYSGSYDSYLECDCEDMKLYHKLKNDLYTVKNKAQLNLEYIKLQERIKETEQLLNCLIKDKEFKDKFKTK
jgi:hypothetical protein